MTESKIGKYIYYHPSIGYGSCSKVYSGINTQNGMKVAVKKIRSDILKNKSMVTRICGEMEIIKHLDHPNIVKLYDIFDSNGMFIITELCNTTLSQYISKNKTQYLDESICLDICSQIKNGLEYLFSKGILHRDIKPENILLIFGVKLRVCLTDFGFAKKYSHDDLESDDLSSTLCGTPSYIAPEILSCQFASVKSDLWSLGLLIHQLFFCGQFPFIKIPGNLLEMTKMYDDDLNKVAKSIEIHFSSRVISNEAKNLLTGLLRVNVNNRMTWDEFFRHDFFTSNKCSKTLSSNLDYVLEEETRLIAKVQFIDNYQNKILLSMPSTSLPINIPMPDTVYGKKISSKNLSPPSPINNVMKYVNKSIRIISDQIIIRAKSI